MPGQLYQALTALLLGTGLIPFALGQDEDPATDVDLLQFQSRPDLFPPRLYVNQSDPDVSPGYIFMAPYQSYQNSAAIYASDGALIWYGFGVTGAGNTHDFNVCQYNGTDNLCFFSGEQSSGYARGKATILNTQLDHVATYQALNGRAAMDQHEFNLVNDSALSITYQPKRYDLSMYNISGGQGWITNGIFQDVDTTTGKLQFEWQSIEHVGLNEGYVEPNQSEVAGTGFSASSPWDYFHINSVDKNSDGDYLISARHTSTLYKIDGRTGEIIWRCGGKFSDFELLNVNWSYQHDARWLEHNASTEVISFFDNASNGFNQSAEHSAGYIIKLNHDASPPTVEVLHTYPAPEDLPISASQGNLQILDPENWATSNVVVGWGSQPYVTEHDSEGNILYRANVGANGRMNYRAYKFDIKLTPSDSPALYTYALNQNSNTTYYMSWNGATEVARWRIYGRTACDGSWALIEEIPKDGFETTYVADGFQEFGMVEAVGGDGTGLRNSTNQGVAPFVPSPSLASLCTAEGCANTTSYQPGGAQLVIAQTQPGCAALAINTNTTEGSNNGDSTSDAWSQRSRISSNLVAWIAVSLGLGLLL